MKISDLQLQYYKEHMNTECVDEEGYFTIDYVQWLQKKVIESEKEQPVSEEPYKYELKDLKLHTEDLAFQLTSEMYNDLMSYQQEKYIPLYTKPQLPVITDEEIEKIFLTDGRLIGMSDEDSEKIIYGAKWMSKQITGK